MTSQMDVSYLAISLSRSLFQSLYIPITTDLNEPRNFLFLDWFDSHYVFFSYFHGQKKHEKNQNLNLRKKFQFITKIVGSWLKNSTFSNRSLFFLNFQFWSLFATQIAGKHHDNYRISPQSVYITGFPPEHTQSFP